MSKDLDKIGMTVVECRAVTEAPPVKRAERAETVNVAANVDADCGCSSRM